MFHPLGPAVPLSTPKNPSIIISGPIVSTFTTSFGDIGWRSVSLSESGKQKIKKIQKITKFQKFQKFKSQFSFFFDLCAEQFVEVVYHVTMVTQAFNNKELITRFSTEVESASRFYTDLQGLSMKMSYRRDDRPIQYNYYPVTSTAFIQDKV